MIAPHEQFRQRRSAAALVKAILDLCTLIEEWCGDGHAIAGLDDRAALALQMGVVEADELVRSFYGDVDSVIEQIIRPWVLGMDSDQVAMEESEDMEDVNDLMLAEWDICIAAFAKTSPNSAARLGLLVTVCAELGVAWSEHAMTIANEDPSGAWQLSRVADDLAALSVRHAAFGCPDRLQITAAANESLACAQPRPRIMHVHVVVSAIGANDRLRGSNRADRNSGNTL